MTDHSAATVAGTHPASAGKLEPDAIGAAQDTIIDVTGLLFSIFYILTALAAITYYRRRVASSAFDFVTVGLLPLGAAGFLGWIFVKSLGEAPWSQRWSLIAIVIAGLVLLLVARFVLHSSFFQLQRESE